MDHNGKRTQNRQRFHILDQIVTDIQLSEMNECSDGIRNRRDLITIQVQLFQRSDMKNGRKRTKLIMTSTLSTGKTTYNDNFRRETKALKVSSGIDEMRLFDKTNVLSSVKILTKEMFSSLLLFKSKHFRCVILANAKSGIIPIRLFPRFRNTTCSRAKSPRIPFPDKMLPFRLRYVNSWSASRL